MNKRISKAILLGGGVSKAEETLLDPLRTMLADALAWRPAPLVRRSLLGTAGGRVGASVLAFRAAGRGHYVDSWHPDTVLADPAPAASPAAASPAPAASTPSTLSTPSTTEAHRG